MNKMYIFGGSSPYLYDMNDLWAYDVMSNRWQLILTTGSRPEPRLDM